ncbi:hypothetical protein BSYN_23490 [Bacteroides sedimenti]|uniref:Uncharacterized protein n=1 Tax=Bacteroides sedimenti TaxID=2136147 RepID=A0ABN6Z793_9BACE
MIFSAFVPEPEPKIAIRIFIKGLICAQIREKCAMKRILLVKYLLETINIHSFAAAKLKK